MSAGEGTGWCLTGGTVISPLCSEVIEVMGKADLELVSAASCVSPFALEFYLW